MKKYLSTVFYLISCLVLTATTVHVQNSQKPKLETVKPGIVEPAKTPQPSTPNSKSDRPSKPQPIHNTNPRRSATAPQSIVNKVEIAGVNEQSQTITDKDGKVYPLRTYKPLLMPNDTNANQWWVSPNNMSRVWDIPAGARATKIAVIDTGFALDHQEFSDRWAINAAESGALSTNGLDDDSNGFVDDWRGWDFTGNDNNVQAGQTNPSGTGTTHGTMVAGVLGATGNNSIGIAGVNWYTSILPMQALNDDSYGNSYTVGQAIYYAADQNVDVISISLGTASDDPYLRQAMLYALNKGVAIVAASGNDGCNCLSYPANYPEVIAVGAVDSTNNAASFSSYGANLDLLAPGASMTSTYWSAGNPTNAYASNIAGTSFATPFVAGLLGLARSQQPNASWDSLVGAMLEQSDRRGLSATTPRSNAYGYGVARAGAMLDRAVLPNTSLLRYQFASLGGNAYQCEEGVIPTTLLFELSKGTSVRYTASQLEKYRASLDGWTSRNLFYGCMGLPTDTISFLRTLNLSAELRGTISK